MAKIVLKLPLKISFPKIPFRGNRKPKRTNLPLIYNLPNELIDHICSFLDAPQSVALALTCSKFYLALLPTLSKLAPWEIIECQRVLQKTGYYRTQQLPCFSCGENHPFSHFYRPERSSPLPQCIAKCSTWKCLCSSVTADEIRVAVQASGTQLAELFRTCTKCHDDEGLSFINESAAHGRITHTIAFTLPHIGTTNHRTTLPKAVGARARTLPLPLCRHLSLADARVLDTLDPTCLGTPGNMCPTDCATRRFHGHTRPLTACPMPGCGLTFGISQQYLGHPDESWRVIITISRELPRFREHLRRDRAWSSLAFTNKELTARLPGVFKKPDSKRDDLLALLFRHFFGAKAVGGWDFEVAELRQFWKCFRMSWADS